LLRGRERLERVGVADGGGTSARPELGVERGRGREKGVNERRRIYGEELFTYVLAQNGSDITKTMLTI